MSEKLTQSALRIIINDFVKEINAKKETGAKPEKAVIDFRHDKQLGKERWVYLVPTNLLRFRKDNGRIASDIYSYEKLNGKLNETLTETQNIIRTFLLEKDAENNIKLENLIKHSGQNEPAIITCDGFLINGNRRKMILDKLGITTMKVVILPDVGEEGGPPTIKEIEQIENRYQLQSDGKSEYTNFDRAISIKRKIDSGMDLVEQLKDDPSLVRLSEKEFNKHVQKIKDEFLGPLECIDRYLSNLDRDGLYDSISEGRNDKEGRWYSFIDYYKLYKQLQDPKRRNELNLEEDEIGDIEDIAFKIIRKKKFPNIKTHEVIRKMTKFLNNKEARKYILKIKDIPDNLKDDQYNLEDNIRVQDEKWGNAYASDIIGKVTQAIKLIEYEKERETPITLLEDCIKKLNHENMNVEYIDITKLHRAMDLTREIQKKANDLEHDFYQLEKENKRKLKGLSNK